MTLTTLLAVGGMQDEEGVPNPAVTELSILDPNETAGSRPSVIEKTPLGRFKFITQIWVIMPDETWKHIWDWFIIALVIYNFIKIPLDISFDPEVSSTVKGFDWFVDILFALDMLLTFVTCFEDHYGDAVTSRKLIRKRYLTGWFALDFSATCPWDSMITGIIPQSADQGPLLTLLSLLKVLRLGRIGRLMKKLDKFTAATYLRIIFLLISLILYSHISACLFFLVGRLQGDASNTWLVANDLGPDKLNREDEDYIYRAYTHSLYWAMATMTTVGFGDIHPMNELEMWVCNLLFLSGAFVYAMILANVNFIIQKFDIKGEEYKEKMGGINNMLRFFQVDGDLAQQVRDNVTFFWNVSGGYDLAEELQSLPRALRAEIAMGLYGDILKASDVLKECEEPFLRELALKIHPVVALPGQYIYRAGDVGKEMFIVSRGELEVVDASGLEILDDDLHKGMLFGEAAMFNTTDRRPTNVRARTRAEVCQIDRLDFDEVSELFPTERERIHKDYKKQDEMYKVNSQMKELGIFTASKTKDGVKKTGMMNREHVEKRASIRLKKAELRSRRASGVDLLSQVLSESEDGNNASPDGIPKAPRVSISVPMSPSQSFHRASITAVNPAVNPQWNTLHNRLNHVDKEQKEIKMMLRKLTELITVDPTVVPGRIVAGSRTEPNLAETIDPAETTDPASPRPEQPKVGSPKSGDMLGPSRASPTLPPVSGNVETPPTLENSSSRKDAVGKPENDSGEEQKTEGRI